MFNKILRKGFYKFGHGKKAWYQKHINDQYVKKAQELNYRSRAAFKLLELVEKHPQLILNQGKGNKVKLEQIKKLGQAETIRSALDLGSAPGSWCQVLRQIIPHAQIVAVDLLEMKPIQGVEVYKTDARRKQLHGTLHQKYGKFELIVSDMAPNFIGDTSTTHQEILQLNLMCMHLCYQLGAPHCSLVMKTVQGQYQKSFFNLLSNVFRSVSREKPNSSRSESVEFYYVCQKLNVTNAQQTHKLQQFLSKIISNLKYQLQSHKTKKESSAILQQLLEKS